MSNQRDVILNISNDVRVFADLLEHPGLNLQVMGPAGILFIVLHMHMGLNPSTKDNEDGRGLSALLR